VEEQGYVVTMFGRHLSVPIEKSYIGLNYLIQGTAAEIIKRAQVRVDAYLRKYTGRELCILLPVHDELIIECPRRRLRDARDIMRDIVNLMVDFPEFDVPLDVEIDLVVRDWDHKAAYKLG